jgi:anti-sigma factor RsiW
MTCKAYRHREAELEDFAGGALGAAESAQLDAHVRECAECRAAVQEAQASARILRGTLLPAEAPSGAFWTRLNARLNEEQRKQEEFFPELEWLARRFVFGAGLALLVMGAFLAGTQFPLVEGNDNQAEIRELVPRSEQQPTNHDEVLVSLAGNGR